jgi:AraC-like DNA-binding protein
MDKPDTPNSIAPTILLDAMPGLFDPLPDVVFFAKDSDGRYTHANRTLLKRLGLGASRKLIGKTAADVFPAPLGESYLAQDRLVLGSGRALVDVLEHHLFPTHESGWCITRKYPLMVGGNIAGLVGISRDLKTPSKGSKAFARFTNVFDYVRAHYGEEIQIGELAARTGVSIAQFERVFQATMQITPREWILAVRIEAAMEKLKSNASVADISYACGFADHSAFSRSFRRHTGLSPSDYRAFRSGH